MNSIEILHFVEDWLEEKQLKSFFETRKNSKERYIKMKEKDLYKLCYKLVDLIEKNMI